MRRIIPVLLLVLALLSSCSTVTKAMVSPLALDEEKTLGEKLEAFGARKVALDYPEAYFSGEEWTKELLSLIEASHDYILISTFLGSYCEELDDIYSALERKAEEGVRVYYVMDGSSVNDQTLTQYHMSPAIYLKDAGARTLIYNPIAASHVVAPQTFLLRDHRKLFVFDGKTCAIGGMNMNYISLSAGDRTQRDSMYAFHSSSFISTLVDDFVEFWNRNSVETMDRSAFSVDGVEGIYDGWFLNHMDGNQSIAGFYGALFAEAREKVVLLPFLPALDDNMEKAVRDTVGRGVTFRLDATVDDRGSTSKGINWYFNELLSETGATVMVSEKDSEGKLLPLLHEKLVLVDDRYVAIGSANFNFRSMGLSKELVLVMDAPELAVELEEHLKELLKDSYEMTMEKAMELKETNSDFLSYLTVFFGG